MLNISVFRYYSDENSTASVIFVEGKFVCFGVENTSKRITSGYYPVKSYRAGSMHDKYTNDFHFHKGMLEISGVVNRSALFFHIANYWYQLEGCIGVGVDVVHDIQGFKMVSSSKAAYEKFYQLVINDVLKNNCKVLIGDTIDLIKYEDWKQ